MLKVLIVDDSATARSHLSRALSAADFEVYQAVDGIDALGQLSGELAVDLIVCDVNMPRMNGVELVEELARRAAGETVPVIMITTEARPELVARAKASGAKAWMIKPFNRDALVAAATNLARRAA